MLTKSDHHIKEILFPSRCQKNYFLESYSFYGYFAKKIIMTKKISTK